MRRWATTITGLILVIILSILVWDKQSTIYPYLFLSAAIAENEHLIAIDFGAGL
ncbi:MAG: hypothetical protein ACE5IE_04005 [Dehalococcoidia bacterium]